MPLNRSPRTAETSASTGTGLVTLAGALTGCRAFAAVCAVGAWLEYLIEAVDGAGMPTGQWEAGIGRYIAANTLSRLVVLGSSTGSKVNFAAGNKVVCITNLQRNRDLVLSDFGPANPLYIAHRGGSIVYPEDTNVAYREVLEGGAVVAIEQDVQVTSDGALVVMHDGTVDRTTTGSGAVAALTAAQWAALVIDATAQSIYGFGDATHPPFFADVLNAFRGRAIFVPEVKATPTVKQSLVDALITAGIPNEQALVQSFGVGDLTPAILAGYQGMFLTGDSTGIAAAQAVGATWVGLYDGAPDSDFAAWINAGFKVVSWTPNRRKRRDYLLGLGVSGFFTDDPVYMATSGRLAARDTFSKGRWMSGMQSCTDLTVPSERGSINAGGWFGWADPAHATNVFKSVLQGWAGALEEPNFTVTFTARINAVFSGDQTRWCSCFIGDSSMGDAAYNDGNVPSEKGYHFLIRKNGTIAIFKTGGGSTTSVASDANAAMAMGDGVSNTFRISVSPTTVRLARLDGSGNELQFVTVADNTYRGGYLHFGRNACIPEFKDVVIG